MIRVYLFIVIPRSTEQNVKFPNLDHLDGNVLKNWAQMISLLHENC